MAPTADDEYRWKVTRDADAIWCGGQVRQIAAALGFSELACAGIAITCQELITNAVRYAGGGVVTVREVLVPQPGLELIVEDEGPGIDDPEAALRDGFSKGRDLSAGRGSVRGCIGSGLGAVKRLMDELTIENRPEGGTRIRVAKWIRYRRT